MLPPYIFFYIHIALILPILTNYWFCAFLKTPCYFISRKRSRSAHFLEFSSAIGSGGQNKNKRNNFAWLKIELLHKYIIQMIEYNNNITYKKNFGIWFACIGFELLTCDLAPVVQEAGWSFQSFSTHSIWVQHMPPN